MGISLFGGRWCGKVGQLAQLALRSDLEGVKYSPNRRPFGTLQSSSASTLVTLSGTAGFFPPEFRLDLDESSVSPEWVDSLDEVKDSGSRTEGTIPLRISSKNRSTRSLIVCSSLRWALRMGSLSNAWSAKSRQKFWKRLSRYRPMRIPIEVSAVNNGRYRLLFSDISLNAIRYPDDATPFRLVKSSRNL